MSFIATIAPDAAAGATAEMYRRQQASWSFVPNYAKVFSHRPEIMARWGQLLAEIKRPMEPRRFELVTFIAAHALGNTACTLTHGKALRPFFSDAQILAIAKGRLDGVLDAAEQAMLRFARQVAIDAARVTAADVAALARHGFADAEIFDIAAAAAGRAFFTKMLDALGVLADAPMGPIDATLRRALTVGRPIDERPPATMPAAPPLHATLEGDRHAA
ncbi:MAG TPA: hypothetical protein VIK58_14665 [Caldimonas sp.]